MANKQTNEQTDERTGKQISGDGSSGVTLVMKFVQTVGGSTWLVIWLPGEWWRLPISTNIWLKLNQLKCDCDSDSALAMRLS